MAKEIPQPQCASCPYDWSERYCRQSGGKGPKNCPSLHHRDLAAKTLEILKDPQVFEFARQASIQEGEGYAGGEKGYGALHPVKPRIQEVVEFCHKMKYKNLSLVFCVGVRFEAKVVQQILETNGLNVVSVMCKAGRIGKEEIGLIDEQKVVPGGFESMCNPILQALIANYHQVDFNVLLGLCVGHDSLFLKYAEAFSTVLAVKDRLLGHNPMAAIYNYDHYYRTLKNPIE